MYIDTQLHTVFTDTENIRVYLYTLLRFNNLLNKPHLIPSPIAPLFPFLRYVGGESACVRTCVGPFVILTPQGPGERETPRTGLESRTPIDSDVL